MTVRERGDTYEAVLEISRVGLEWRLVLHQATLGR
jgi:hypothetical protein